MANQITPNPSVPSQVVAEVKFPKFINNLGIIPTSYKDSMSYYECLAWLCKFLEEQVIPTVNENGEAVEELQALYVELNSYVTHYFETLDVQEEINNKLDDMVEDGTLENIIKNYINDSIIKSVDNVSDLINADFETDFKVKTLGYYEPNDGGSALYVIKDEEPSGYYETLENGKFAELIIENNTVYTMQLGGLNSNISSKIQKFINSETTIVVNCNTILNGLTAIDKNVNIKTLNNSKITITDNLINVVENPEAYADITLYNSSNNSITTSLNLNVGDIIKIANDNEIVDSPTGKAYYGEFFIISNKNGSEYSLDRVSQYNLGNLSNLKAYKFSNKKVNIDVNIIGNLANTSNVVYIKGGCFHNININIDKWKNIVLKLKSCYGYIANVISNYQPSDPTNNNALGYAIDDSASSNFKAYFSTGANRHGYACAGQIVSDETWLHGLCTNGEISGQVSGYSSCLCDDHPFAYNLNYNNVINNRYKNNGIITSVTYESAITQRSAYNTYNNIKAFTNNIYESQELSNGCIIKNSEFYDNDTTASMKIVNNYGTAVFKDCTFKMTKLFNMDCDSEVIFNNCNIICNRFFMDLLTSKVTFNNCYIEIEATGSTGTAGEIIMNNCTVVNKGTGACRIFSGSGATIRINNLCFINPFETARNMVPVFINSEQPVFLQNISLVGNYSNSSSNPMTYVFGDSGAVAKYQNITGLLSQNFNS